MNRFWQWWESFWAIIEEIFAGEYAVEQQRMQTQPQQQQPTPQPETLLWDTQKHSWHSVRVLCDNAGLDVEEKNLICSCIYQESQFANLRADGTPVRNDNYVNGRLASSDWGICQINDYWHVKRYPEFSSVDDIVQNPQKAVQFMIDCYKHGQLKQWVSFSSGANKQWLLPNSPMWALAN